MQLVLGTVVLRQAQGIAFGNGGETGIRTQESISGLHALQACSLDQLGHLSGRQFVRLKFGVC